MRNPYLLIISQRFREFCRHLGLINYRFECFSGHNQEVLTLQLQALKFAHHLLALLKELQTLLFQPLLFRSVARISPGSADFPYRFQYRL